MTITLSAQAHDELFQEAEENAFVTIEGQSSQWDWICPFPSTLGEGWIRGIQLREGIELEIYNYQLHDELVVNHSDFIASPFYSLCLQGEFSYADVPHEPGQHLVCGSGLAPASGWKELAKQPSLSIYVWMQPRTLRSLIGNSDGEVPTHLQHLVHSADQPCNWHLETITPVMKAITRQILQCPYQGISRRIYLESKALELLALLMHQEIELQAGKQPTSALRPDQIERILHHARDILLRQIEQPPSLTQLAQQAKLNEFMLKQEFRQVFGKTVFGYLHDHRMEQAQQLLKMGGFRVAEVGRMVGYSDCGAFTKAFRRKFGMSPSDYCRSTQYY